MNATTDYIRTTIGGISARMNPTNMAAVLSPLIAATNTVKVRDIVGSTGILITDNTLFCDCTAGNIALTLPAPSTAYDSTNTTSITFTIAQKVDAGNTVTINPNASESIYNGGSAQSSVVLSSGAAVSFETDGTSWITTSA